MPGRALQAKALLLLLVFLAAGTSLPSLDALAFHGDAGGERSQTHVEPAGGCPSHTGHCSLGRGAPGSGSGLAVSRELRLQGSASAHTLPPPVVEAPPAVLLGTPQSRAPPVRFA